MHDSTIQKLTLFFFSHVLMIRLPTGNSSMPPAPTNLARQIQLLSLAAGLLAPALVFVLCCDCYKSIVPLHFTIPGEATEPQQWPEEAVVQVRFQQDFRERSRQCKQRTFPRSRHLSARTRVSVSWSPLCRFLPCHSKLHPSLEPIPY